MRNARKLKATNIFINDDLCAVSQAIKNAQMPLMKQAKAQGKVAFFRHTKLIIREKNTDSDAATRGQQPVEDEGAVGGVTAGVSGAGAKPGSATAGDVVCVQVADAWSDGKGDGLPSLPTPRTDGSRHSRHQSTPSDSPQHKQEKKTLRSTVKKWTL